MFDPRDNCLNLIRLILAASVIIWHSFPLTGNDVGSPPLRQILASTPVDAFFAISGYLIVSSWQRHPSWRAYLRARVLRILPAYWVALVVTAGVIAPSAVWVQTGTLTRSYWEGAADYLQQNSLLWVNEYAIAGTPSGIPYPQVWNGSMWTLAWEFLCYLGVLAFGVLGLLRWKVATPALFVAMEAAVLATSYGPLDNFYVRTAAHFGIFFAAGALLHELRERIPVDRRLLAAALVLALAATLLPDYRVVAALPVAYLMVSLGALGKGMQVRNDVSYGTYIYAFPIQQWLVTCFGATELGVLGLAVSALVVTLPIAAASWFLVEQPALRWKDISRPRTAQQSSVRSLT